MVSGRNKLPHITPEELRTFVRDGGTAAPSEKGPLATAISNC